MAVSFGVFYSALRLHPLKNLCLPVSSWLKHVLWIVGFATLWTKEGGSFSWGRTFVSCKRVSCERATWCLCLLKSSFQELLCIWHFQRGYVIALECIVQQWWCAQCAGRERVRDFLNGVSIHLFLFGQGFWIYRGWIVDKGLLFVRGAGF